MKKPLHTADCPPDSIYFLDPSQLQMSDLSALPLEELIDVQGDVNRMFELMNEYQRIRIPEGAERTVGFALKIEE